MAEQADLQAKTRGRRELGPTFEDQERTPSGSSGQCRRAPSRRRAAAVALCRLLLSKPDLLLLDEPTNHLHASRGHWSGMQVYPGTVAAVTHDRYSSNAGWLILEPDRGAGIPWKTTLPASAAQARLAAEEKADRSYRPHWNASSSGPHVAARLAE